MKGMEKHYANTLLSEFTEKQRNQIFEYVNHMIFDFFRSNVTIETIDNIDKITLVLKAKNPKTENYNEIDFATFDNNPFRKITRL